MHSEANGRRRSLHHPPPDDPCRERHRRNTARDQRPLRPAPLAPFAPRDRLRRLRVDRGRPRLRDRPAVDPTRLGRGRVEGARLHRRELRQAKEAARLRKRYQVAKDKLRRMAEEQGLVERADDS
jgi:hypothetical protein